MMNLPQNVILRSVVSLRERVARSNGVGLNDFASELARLRREYAALGVGGPARAMFDRVADGAARDIAAAKARSRAALRSYYADTVGASVLDDYRAGNVTVLRAG